MRIGTWNLDGRWTERQSRFLLDGGCDVWLLTEVDPRVAVPGLHGHLAAGSMARGQRFAGVFSRVEPVLLPDPHPASASARIGDLTCCSTVLPWLSCGGAPTWPGADHAEKTAIAVGRLLDALAEADRLVWGGDWNHALDGREWAGSRGGRTAIVAAAEKLGLQVPTAELPHRLGGLSIDHIAVHQDRRVTGVERLDARGLSDHDAYVLDVED